MLCQVASAAYFVEPSKASGSEARCDSSPLIWRPKLREPGADQPEVANVLCSGRQRRARETEALDGQMGSSIDTHKSLRIGFDVVQDIFKQFVGQFFEACGLRHHEQQMRFTAGFVEASMAHM